MFPIFFFSFLQLQRSLKAISLQRDVAQTPVGIE